jgi:hypothetical protein
MSGSMWIVEIYIRTGARVPAVEAWVIEPLWVLFEALLPPRA